MVETAARVRWARLGRLDSKATPGRKVRRGLLARKVSPDRRARKASAVKSAPKVRKEIKAQPEHAAHAASAACLDAMQRSRRPQPGPPTSTEIPRRA